MANVNITIGTPVLVSGEHFKVRYRLLPGGSFSAPQNETNAQFTLTGLSDGNYELEVILVKADSSECPPTYQIFTVVTPYECIDFTAEIVQQDNGMFYLVISYTLPPGFTDPTCGWDIVYNGNTVHYAALPASPINIPVPNATTSLQIIANNCNGNKSYCFDDDVPPIEPTCVPLVITSVTIAVNSLSTKANPNFEISINYTQSAPCTTAMIVTSQQINVLAGVPFTSTFNLTSTPCNSGLFSYGTNPNPNVQNVFDPDTSSEKKKYEFIGTVIDRCGKTHPYSVSILY